MKVNVKAGEEWFIIPCIHKNKNILWLIEEAIERLSKRTMNELKPAQCELRSASNNHLYDGNDLLHDVLEDNDFVVIGKIYIIYNTHVLF